MDEITVNLIDDHAVMRRGLALLLGTQHGDRDGFGAANRAEAVAIALRKHLLKA